MEYAGRWARFDVKDQIAAFSVSSALSSPTDGLIIHSKAPLLLPADLFDLAGLKRLIISSNAGLQTNLNNLDRLTRLSLLALIGARITSFPRSLLRLEGLTRLSLRCNRLTQLPPEIGQLHSVQYLDLRCNELSLLPSEIGGLSSLAGLWLRDNHLQQLPPSVGALTSLTCLDVAHNRLATLPLTLGRVTGLVQLYASANPLDPGLVELLSKGLFTLLFYFRFQLALPPGAVAGTHFAAFPPKSSGWSLADTRALALQGANLQQLPEGLLERLTDLNVSENRLQELPVHALLQHCSGLQRLVLDGNLLQTLPGELARLSHLHTLSAQRNDLRLLPAEFAQLGRSLLQLQLAFNRLQAVPALFLHCATNLRVLNLSHNALAALPAEVGRLLQLEELLLRCNQLHILPPELAHLTQLRVLDLAFNCLRLLPPELLRSLRGLRRLDLRGNRLRTLEPLPPLPALEHLALASNRLAQMPLLGSSPSSPVPSPPASPAPAPAVPHPLVPEALRVLDVSHLRLAKLPAAIGLLRALTRLNASFNILLALPPEIAGCTALEWLDLRYNQIRTLPAELARLTRLRRLKLDANPLPPRLRANSLPALLAELTRPVAPVAAAAAAAAAAEDRSRRSTALLRDPDLWTPGEVAAFLRLIGLSQYARVFARHQVTGRLLFSFTEEELRSDLGMSVKQARLLMRELQERRAAGGSGVVAPQWAPSKTPPLKSGPDQQAGPTEASSVTVSGSGSSSSSAEAVGSLLSERGTPSSARRAPLASHRDHT